MKLPVIANIDALPLLVAGALFMENLDATVIVTALPQMAETFHVHAIDMNIGISAYLLTLTVLIPASGWIAQKFGSRRVFCCALFLFTLASILCSLSHSLGTFTLWRILQGLAGALMVPVGRLVVLRNTSKGELIKAIATITWPGLVAPIIGPPLGGLITTYSSWHGIFLLNVPLGIIALYLSNKLLPITAKETTPPFDIPGFIFTGSACFGLIFSLDLLSQSAVLAWRPFIYLLASCLLGSAAIFHARHCRAPLLSLKSMQIKSYAVTILGGSLFRIAIGAMPFLLPLLFQLGYGMTPFAAGGLVLAVFAGNLLMKPFTSAILYRFHFRTILLTLATPLLLTFSLLFISGMTRSMQFTALNTLAFSQVPAAQMTDANTLFNMVQQLSSGLGIAFAAVSLRVAQHIVSSDVDPLRSFHLAFMAMGVIALLGLIDGYRLPLQAGDEIRARH